MIYVIWNVLHSGSRRDKTVVGTLPGREITRGVGL